MTTPRFDLLVPVKNGHAAKTRLSALGPDTRATLMTAFAGDALDAALRAAIVEVHVVGDAAALPAMTGGSGIDVVPDEGGGDLNEALRRAAARVARADRGVAVMLADLPCLRPEDLELALIDALGRGERCFVADAAGTGTTLLVAAPGVDLRPCFGPGSAKAHAASGAIAITADVPSLRMDVDTAGDLERARRFGLGQRTAAVVASLPLTAG